MPAVTPKFTQRILRFAPEFNQVELWGGTELFLCCFVTAGGIMEYNVTEVNESEMFDKLWYHLQLCETLLLAH